VAVFDKQNNTLTNYVYFNDVFASLPLFIFDKPNDASIERFSASPLFITDKPAYYLKACIGFFGRLHWVDESV